MQQINWEIILVIVAGFGGIYTVINVRLKALEVEVKQLQKNEERTDKKFDAIGEKMDEIKEGIANILIQLEKKQDRKN